PRAKTNTNPESSVFAFMAWLTCSLTTPLPEQYPDSQHDVLRRLDQCHAYDCHQLPRIEISLRHRRAVAADEVGGVGRWSQEHPLLPLREEKVFDRSPDIGPEQRIVPLEQGPLQAADDRLFNEDQGPPHGYKLQIRTVEPRAGARKTDAAIRNSANDVYPLG